MSSPDEFSEKLYVSAEQKILWFNSVALQKILEEYRNYHSAIKNVISLLLKKRLIVEDPYKHEKKVLDITIPDDSDFKESDSASILGMRISEYESSLDFLCNYTRFTIENLSLERIRKLTQFNAFFTWNALSHPSTRSNSRALGAIFSSIKMSGDTLSASLINNIISVSTKSITIINDDLKTVADMQKELYKIDVRKTILDSSSFATESGTLTVENGVSRIKKIFPSLMGRKSFYTELIEELVQEEAGPDKETRKQCLLNRFNVTLKKTENTIAEVDPKNIILDAVRIFGAFSPQFDVILQKISENHLLLQTEHSNMWGKLIASCRKAFGLNEKAISYKIKLVEPRSQIATIESLNYADLIDSLTLRSRLYTSMSSKSSPAYQKMEQQRAVDILEYVQKKISESQSLYTTLVGLDEFFKSEISLANRSKVKGLLMELTTVKNTLMTVNQIKAEYVSLVAEQEQMKKLGITNE